MDSIKKPTSGYRYKALFYCSPSSVAIERIEPPATTARDISSRSDNDSANLERQRTLGRILPVTARMLVALKQLRDLLERVSFLSTLPHQRFLGFGVINPRSLLHLQHSSC